DRKVKQAGFIVLHQTFMPSVLVEVGFLTNKNEGSYLNSKKGQEEMGRSIADAILAYKNEVDLGLEALEGDLPVEDAPGTLEVPAPGTEDPEAGVPAVEKTQEEAPAGVTTTDSGVVFKVQILATVKDIALEGRNFNGLDVLSRERHKNLYRYMYGRASSLDGAKELKTHADAKGYPTSYIVAYKDGIRVPLNKVND